MPHNTRRTFPGVGQESVWDYPRPPRLERSTRRLRILFGGVTIADSTSACRVLETSHPPTWYIPPVDLLPGCLVPTEGVSHCEFKGCATYWTLRVGPMESRAAAWSYHHPTPPFAGLRDYLAFYPSRVDACYLDEEKVQSQSGDFYGGWITSDIVGPFKGGPGTGGW